MNRLLYVILFLFLFSFIIPSSAQVPVKKAKTTLVEDEEEDDEEDDGEDDEEDEDEDDEEDDGEDEEDDEDGDEEDEAVNNEDIDMPEAMLDDLESLLNDYHNKTYLQVDGDCNMKDENPTFPDEVYADRLHRMPTAIEMPYNDVVRRFIDRYSGRLRRSVSIMLGAENFYMPFFEQALETYNLPLELKYLPVIESALKPKAVSRVGATGLWQFMLATGRQYGLRVNSLVDERCDPEKASYAAAHFLRDLYRIFGDWHLVIAAYNCGPQNVNKAIKRAGGVKDYWKIYPYLPAETRGYVPAFIAANYIMNYYCEHNICPMRTTLPAATDTILINKDLHFKQVSEVLKIDIEKLRAINPMYRRDIVNGASGNAVLRLPIEYTNAFIENEDSIYAYNASELLKRTYVEVNDQVPSYSRSSYTRSSKSKYSKGKKGKRGKNSVRGKKGKKDVKGKSSKKNKNAKGKKSASKKSNAKKGKAKTTQKGAAKKGGAKKGGAKKKGGKKRR